MCTTRKGVKDLLILAQGSPASGWFTRRPFYPPFLWRTVFGKVTRRPAGGLIRRFYGGLF